MATIDDKLDALNVRIEQLESLCDESDPESEMVFWLNKHFGNSALHFKVIQHEILMLTDETYVAEVYKLQEDSSDFGMEDVF